MTRETLANAAGDWVGSRTPTTTAEHRDAILAFLHPGDIFGELAVVDEAPRDHLAEAYEDAVICAMSRETVLRVIHETPELGFQITKLIGLRLRTFKSRIEALLCRSAHARVAHALLDLADRHGIHDSDGILLALRISQGDLGRLVGLSRETVNGILQEWRELNLLTNGSAQRAPARSRPLEADLFLEQCTRL